MKFEIRPYYPEDREACLEVFKGNCPKYFAQNELADFEFWLDGQDTGQLAYGNSSAEPFFVMGNEAVVVGCGGFFILRDQPRARMAWGMIENARHSSGLGQQLLEFRVVEVIAKYPNHKIELNTSQFTFGFYQKYGFVVRGSIKDGFGPGMDKVEMIRNG